MPRQISSLTPMSSRHSCPLPLGVNCAKIRWHIPATLPMPPCIPSPAPACRAVLNRNSTAPAHALLHHHSTPDQLHTELAHERSIVRVGAGLDTTIFPFV